MNTLFVIEDKTSLEQELSSDDRFTDVFARYPLSAQEVRLIVNGLKVGRFCAVVATAAEAIEEEYLGIPF